MITQAKTLIEQDYEIMKKKSQYKQRQKNQFTKEDNFHEKFIQKYGSKQLKKVSLIEVSLPKSIIIDNIFRLKSNVQIPRNANNQYQLGELNIDFYCYNYKINKIDRKDNLVFITFDPIQRCFTPVENVVQVLSKGGEQLKNAFEKLNHKKLDQSQYQIIKEIDFFNFQNSLDKPYIGYISKVIGDQVITQQRFMNELYLNMIGINSDMLIHYAMDTGYLPIPLYFSENNVNLQYLSNFFTLNTFNKSVNHMEICNYNGQKFPVQITFHNYYCYNQNEECYYEYLFFIADVDKKWISKQRVQENYLNYFNLKCDPFSQPQVYYNSTQRCGYRNI